MTRRDLAGSTGTNRVQTGSRTHLESTGSTGSTGVLEDPVTRDPGPGDQPSQPQPEPNRKAQTMTDKPDLDLARFPHEVRRAADRAGVLIEAVDPGLYVQPGEPGSDMLRVTDRHGTEVCSVPLYRLRPVDVDRLEPFAREAIEAQPVAEQDQIRAALNAEGWAIAAPPDSDHVTLAVDDKPLCVVHRRHLVDGWPDTDV